MACVAHNRTNKTVYDIVEENWAAAVEEQHRLFITKTS
jgi:hypothetical protein